MSAFGAELASRGVPVLGRAPQAIGMDRMKPKDQDEKERGPAEARKSPDQRTMERAHEKEAGGFVHERRADEAREEQERLDQVGGEPRRIEPAPVPGMSPKTRR